MDKRDFMRKILQKEDVAEEASLMITGENDGDREQGCPLPERNGSPLPESERTFLHSQHTQVRLCRCSPQAGPAAMACRLLCFCITSLNIFE